MATAVDPICKMEVNPDSPPGGRSDHNGKTYYFCAPGCKAAFDKEPGKYLTTPPATSSSEGRGSFLGRLLRRKP
jgi:YHS domain-containing protein